MIKYGEKRFITNRIIIEKHVRLKEHRVLRRIYDDRVYTLFTDRMWLLCAYDRRQQ